MHERLLNVRVVLCGVLGVVRSMHGDALTVIERPPPAVLLVFVALDASHDGDSFFVRMSPLPRDHDGVHSLLDRGPFAA
jgi:hypothetical protein